MDKKKQMMFNINNFLLAVTDILDARECENKGLDKQHSLRVAYISLRIAQNLDLEPKALFDLCAYSLFHNFIDEEKAFLLELDNSDNKLSNIVEFVHNIEEKFDFSKSEIANRKLITDELESLRDDTSYKNILQSLCTNLEFWLDCQSSGMMLQYIYTSLHDFTQALEFEKVLEITTMFGSLQEDISKLLERANKVCEHYQFEHKDRLTFLIAASMMNFGKLAISEKIIEKKGTLTAEEFEIVKSNVYYLKNALKNIYSFDDISKWASRHHERLDGKGYPSGLKANSLSLKDRVMAILNIYNSCLCKKSYRDILNDEQRIKIIHKKVDNNEIDKAIVEDLETILKK